MDVNYRKFYELTWKILEATPHETTAVRPFTFNFKNQRTETNKTYGTLLENQVGTHEWYSSMERLHMDVSVLADQLELIHICSV